MNRTLALVLASALLAVTAARAEEAKKEAMPAEGKAAKSEDRPYVDAALAFLKGYTHSTRKGEAGDKAWADLSGNAGAKVSVKIGGKEYAVDAAGKKAEASLVKFSKLSTLRDEKDAKLVKGVTLDVVEFMVGNEKKSGKAKVMMSESGGKWVVDSIEVE